MLNTYVYYLKGENMPKKTTWRKEQLEEAVKKNYSIRAVLKEINLKPTGGNYKSIKRHIKNYEFDTSHFSGKAHLKGKTHNWAKKLPLEKILVENSSYTHTSNLRIRLIKEKIFKHICSSCENEEWLDKPIPLELDHINGINNDNRIENLRLLCPNCHAQTDNYRGKNVKKFQKFDKRTCNACNKVIRNDNKSGYCEKHYYENLKKIKNKTTKTCISCNNSISKKTKGDKCFSCYTHQRKFNPCLEELRNKMEELNWNYCAVGRYYNVSDNAIRKRCKKLNIFKPH